MEGNQSAFLTCMFLSLSLPKINKKPHPWVRIKEECERGKEEFEFMELDLRNRRRRRRGLGGGWVGGQPREYHAWDSRRIHFKEEAVSSGE